MSEEPVSSDVTAALAVPTVGTFKCKQCGREFGKAQALATHEIRAHRQFWSTNQKAPGKNRRRVAKNATYLKYRDRYHAQGLNAKGQPYKRRPKAGRKPGSQSKECPICHNTYATRAIMGAHLRKYHGKSLTQFETWTGITSPNGALRRGRKNPKHKRGATTCPVCKKDFSSAYIYAHVRHQHGTTLMKATRAAEREREPDREPERPASKPRREEGREILYCPVCGTNIHAVRTAVNFADQQ